MPMALPKIVSSSYFPKHLQGDFKILARKSRETTFFLNNPLKWRDVGSRADRKCGDSMVSQSEGNISCCIEEQVLLH